MTSCLSIGQTLNRNRRRLYPCCFLFVIAILAGLPISGCGGSGPRTIPPGALRLSTSSLDFQDTLNELSFEIYNSGTTSLAWQSATSRNWIQVTPPSGTISPGQRITLTVTIDRALLIQGLNSGTVSISSQSGGGSVTIHATGLLANLTVQVRDACNHILPGVWVAVQDQMTTYLYQTNTTELERQFVNLRAPYVVSFSYPQQVAGFPRAQSFIFKTEMTISYRVPVNGDQCPPPPPPPPTYGTIEGTITGVTGAGTIDLYTSLGNYCPLPAGTTSFTLPHPTYCPTSRVRAGTMMVYAYERESTGRRLRFGFTRNVVVTENQTTQVTLDLASPFSLHLTGNMLYPSGFIPDSAPIGPGVFTSLNIVGAGFVPSIGDSLLNPPIQSYDILLPDFSALPLDPAIDTLLISANAVHTVQNRGTPSNADDWRRTVSWSTTRLLGQVISGQPVPVEFPDPAIAQSPEDGATVSRANLTLKWQPPATAEPTSYFVQLLDASTNQVLWNISCTNIGYNQVTLPVFSPNYDPLPVGGPVRWAVYASFPVGSTSDFGRTFTVIP
ncbi:MAG: BACON domain-containing protein [bacterium JZ-2024 1]